MDTITKGFLSFVDVSHIFPSRKTHTWEVRNKNGIVLGSIEWAPIWRKYTFRTIIPIILDSLCMRDIADFCDEHKEDRVIDPKPLFSGTD